MRHGQVTTHCSAGMQVKQCENLCGNTVCSVTNWRGRIPKQRPLQLVWTRLAIGCHVLIFGRECWNSYGRMSWACERVTIFLSQKSRCEESSWAWTFSHGGFCSVRRCWQRICSVWHGCAVGDQTPMCGWMLVQRFCWKHLLDLCSTNALCNEQRLISKTSMCVWWHSKKLLAGVGDIASKWVRGCAKAAGQHSVFREKALPLVACIWPGSVGQRWLAYGMVWCSHPTSATSHAGSIWVWCCVCLRRSRKSAEHPGLWRAATCWPASAAIKTWGSRRTAWQRGGGAGDGQTADLAARWYKARFWNIWTSGIGRFHWMDTAAWRRATEKVSVLWCLPGSGREMFGGGQRSRYLSSMINRRRSRTSCLHIAERMRVRIARARWKLLSVETSFVYGWRANIKTKVGSKPASGKTKVGQNHSGRLGGSCGCGAIHGPGNSLGGRCSVEECAPGSTDSSARGY